jgi:hypothetical protein
LEEKKIIKEATQTKQRDIEEENMNKANKMALEQKNLNNSNNL